MNDNIGSQFRISTRLLHNGKLVILTYYSKLYLNFTYLPTLADLADGKSPCRVYYGYVR